MQLRKYTHRDTVFYKGSGLNIYKKETDIFPLKLMLNNTSLSWKLKSGVWLSVKQLKKILK